MKKKDYQYGRDPNPKNWFEAADIIKALNTKPKPDKPKDKK